MIIDETLRKYPPAYIGPRRSIEAFEFRGHACPASAHVQYCSWASHHLPDVWPEPEEFRPQRFSEENKAKLPLGAYVPFGGGSRTCIGMRFGQAEIAVIARGILERFRLELLPGYELRHPPRADDLARRRAADERAGGGAGGRAGRLTSARLKRALLGQRREVAEDPGGRVGGRHHDLVRGAWDRIQRGGRKRDCPETAAVQIEVRQVRKTRSRRAWTRGPMRRAGNRSGRPYGVAAVMAASLVGVYREV